MSAAMTSRNRVIAICTPWTVVSRSLLMSLIITFMLEPAKLQMNCARASGASTPRIAFVDDPAVGVPVMCAPAFLAAEPPQSRPQNPLASSRREEEPHARHRDPAGRDP